MAVLECEFDGYKVWHMNADHSDKTATITCYEGTLDVGTLHFYKTGSSIPASGTTYSGKIVLRFGEDRLREVLDTLRNERPLYLYFNDSTRVGWLATSKEPVGEEES